MKVLASKKYVLNLNLTVFYDVYSLSDPYTWLIDRVESYFTYLTKFSGSCLLQENICYPKLRRDCDSCSL